MIYLVYCYTNKKNGKKYIGITSRSVEERERNHIYESRNKSNKCYNAPFKRAIRKYGIDGFDRAIIDTAETIEDACRLEMYYIKKYNTYYKYKNSNGYNATIGGEYISMPKDRVVQIDSETLEVVKVCDSASEAESSLGGGVYDAIDTLKKIAKGSYWMYQKTFDSVRDTYKEQIYTANDYICQVSETRELVRIWSGSSKASQSTGLRQGNISSCCTGRRKMCGGYYWCFYRDYMSGQYPRHVDIYNGKAVIQFSCNGDVMGEFSSLVEASEETGIHCSCISVACNSGKRAGGYLWRYKKSYNGELVAWKNPKKDSILKIDENGKILQSYDSVQDAANDVGIKYTGISRAIKKKCRAAGHYWRKVA